MPFEHITDVAYLKQQKKIPPKHHFQSKLKNQTTCNEQDYQIFTTIWKKLEITSLLRIKRSKFLLMFNYYSLV